LSQELERVYTVNLGKALLSVDTHRATRAINMIKEFARHHMKVEEIKIEEDLAHQIWARGARSPPRKIRVRMAKTDDGYVLVSRYDEDVESEIVPEKKKKGKGKEKSSKEVKKEEPAKEVKKEEPAKEVKKEEPAKVKKEEPAKVKKEEPAKVKKEKSTKKKE
jgi:large subunit ribosomal protein L31e